jgi:hypothetical protein
MHYDLQWSNDKEALENLFSQALHMRTKEFFWMTDSDFWQKLDNFEFLVPVSNLEVEELIVLWVNQSLEKYWPGQKYWLGWKTKKLEN